MTTSSVDFDVTALGRPLRQYDLIRTMRSIPVYVGTVPELHDRINLITARLVSGHAVITIKEHDVLIYMGTVESHHNMMMYNFTMYSGTHNSFVYVPYVRSLLTCPDISNMPRALGLGATYQLVTPDDE